MIFFYIVLYFTILSIYAYISMWSDKLAAQNGRRRKSENSLLLLALMGGSFGIWMATKKPIFHKSSKWYFTFGSVIILCLQFVLVWWILCTFDIQ